MAELKECLIECRTRVDVESEVEEKKEVEWRGGRRCLYTQLGRRAGYTPVEPANGEQKAGERGRRGGDGW